MKLYNGVDVIKTVVLYSSKVLRKDCKAVCMRYVGCLLALFERDKHKSCVGDGPCFPLTPRSCDNLKNILNQMLL
jgi:hypothetical protein